MRETSARIAVASATMKPETSSRRTGSQPCFGSTSRPNAAFSSHRTSWLRMPRQTLLMQQLARPAIHDTGLGPIRRIARLHMRQRPVEIRAKLNSRCLQGKAGRKYQGDWLDSADPVWATSLRRPDVRQPNVEIDINPPGGAFVDTRRANRGDVRVCLDDPQRPGNRAAGSGYRHVAQP